jgi:hypothetical protein
MLKRFGITGALLVLIEYAGITPSAHAQAKPVTKAEAFLFVGGLSTVAPASYERFAVDRVPVFGFGAGFWIAPGPRGLRLGLEFTRESDTRAYTPACTSAGPCSYGARRTRTSSLLVGDLAYVFSEGRIQPYVAGGPGLLLYSIETEADGNVPGYAHTDYVQTVDVSGGVKIFFTPALSLNPGLRAAVSKEHSAISFGVGVGYHW